MHSEWKPNIGGDQRARAAKSIRGDADHSVRLTVDVKIAADKILAPAHPFPESIARHYNGNVCIRPRFFSTVKAAAKRFHTHHREEIFRSQKREAAPHIMILSDPRNGEFERGKIDKQISAVLAHLAKFVV